MKLFSTSLSEPIVALAVSWTPTVFTICVHPLATSPTQLNSIQPTSTELHYWQEALSLKKWWKISELVASQLYFEDNLGMEQTFSKAFSKPKYIIINYFPLLIHLITIQEINEFWRWLNR